ncbi:MAG: PadR family transcriptional regulator [Gemmatimonadota bacterium]
MSRRGTNPWAAWCGPGAFAFGRPGFRWRVFDRGDLKYIILELLSEKPMHGYEVMRALEEESGGCYSASPGSVYPALQMLEDQGYVTSEKADGKRVYRITEEGRAFLREHRERVEDIFDRVSEFSDHFTGRGMRDLTRSFVRLAQASFESAVRMTGDPEALGRLKEVLERAVREVEEARRAAARGEES